jgi:hypothetical protein
MTIVKWLMSTGVCTTAELLALKRENPADYVRLAEMAMEEMKAKNIPIEESVQK